MKELNLYNQYHLGDNIFNINFLNKYTNYDYIFNYYVNPAYISELSKHIINSNIKLHGLYKIPQNSINCWVNGYQMWNKTIEHYNNMLDIFYVNFFKDLCKRLDIENLINDKYDTLYDNFNAEHKINKKFNYLIINEYPFSGQFYFNSRDFIELFDFLYKENLSFISTSKNNITKEFTKDYNMSIVDIGVLSNQCDNIIAVNTAPIISTFNVTNIDSINKRFVLDIKNSFSYNHNIIRLNSLKEIYKFI